VQRVPLSSTPHETYLQETVLAAPAKKVGVTVENSGYRKTSN